MIGRRSSSDMSTGRPGRPGYNAIGAYGAGNLYGDGKAFVYADATLERRPRWATTNASNKASEHNIGNMPVRIVVAQLAPMTSARNLRNLTSNRVVLRPGNQSLGGT